MINIILALFIFLGSYALIFKSKEDYTKCGVVHEKILLQKLYKKQVSHEPTIIMHYDDDTYDDLYVSYDTYYHLNVGERTCFILTKSVIHPVFATLLAMAILVAFIALIYRIFNWFYKIKTNS